MRNASRPVRPTLAALAILSGVACGVAEAQVDVTAPAPAPRPIQGVSAPRPAVGSRPMLAPGVRRVQFAPGDAAPPPPPAVPPSPSTPSIDPSNYGGDSAPPVAEPGGPPVPSDNDLGTPRAERGGGGGEPTTATANAEAGTADPNTPAGEGKGTEKTEDAVEKDETKLLMNGLEKVGVKLPFAVYGWIQNSYTGNTNGVPKSRLNFGVNPNFLANSWMGNQYYLIIEKTLKQDDTINFGFRVDNLFGNDWQFNHMHGLLENKFKLNHFAGYDPAQMYGEVHLPVLTKGGLDIKGGRWYTLAGYEVVPATGRPLLSVPYMFNYGQPFTHVGVMTTLHLTDRVNVYNGAINGWDRWLNTNYKWGYMGGFSWTSKSGNTSWTTIVTAGPNQYPNFNGPGTQIILPGNTDVLNPGFQAGRRNIGYGGNDRFLMTNVVTHKWNEKLTQVMENDLAFESNIPGIGPGGTSQNASWYSYGNWFLYQFNEKVTGVWRSEVFRDNQGVRTGFADNFYEFTLGAIYKPKPYLWIRPEARYDWAQFQKPYNDGTRGSQFTLAFDVILLF